MLKLGMLLIAIGFLVGCTTPKEDALMKSYQKKVDYHKKLQQTEKIQLFENNVTKIVLTATYLYTPTFEKKDTRDEEFIIGVHFEDDGVENIEELMGIRGAEDIQKMREKKREESKHIRDSLLGDITKLIGHLGNDKKVKGENKDNTKYIRSENNTTFTGLLDDQNITSINESNATSENNATLIGLGSDENTTIIIKNENNTVEKYGLTLNKKKAIRIKALSKNDKRLKNIAYVTEWGSYYLVTFEHTESKRFSLVFESEKYGKGTFSFAKVAKYIYTKKGF